MLTPTPSDSAPTESATTGQGDSATSDTPAGQKSKTPPRRPPLRGAKALPSHLERRVVQVAPSPEECTCPGCGQPRKALGEDVSHRLELEPARFYVQVEKRPKLACPRCKQGVTVAPASETPLPGALPGPGLLAQWLVGKYRDGLPLYRQQGIFAQQGYLVVDGYAGYQALFGPASPRIEVGCWMHARRGFERAWQAGDSRGGTVLALIQKLYAVERQASEAALSPEARLALRLEKSAPVYAELFALLEDWAPQVPPKTPLGKALAYAQNRYVPLGRFLEDGRVPVDKGEAERLIKRIALGRKAWLFVGSDEAGHRAAAVYTLVLSCYRLGVDPWAYFRDVLPKLGDTRFPASRLEELLPESWAQQQAQQR